MRRSVFLVALAAGAISGAAACEPPPPPPPSTTVAMQYRECSEPNLNLLANRCYTYIYADASTMTVWTTFGALTTAPTYILAEVHVERQNPRRDVAERQLVRPRVGQVDHGREQDHVSGGLPARPLPLHPSSGLLQHAGLHLHEGERTVTI